MHRQRKKILQVETGNLFRDRFYAAFRYAYTLATVGLPQGSHHVIERFRALGAVADGEIECQSDDRAFLVITNDGVRRILILTIVFDPGIKTRVSYALFAATGLRHDTADVLGDQLQIRKWLNESGADENKIIEIAGDAFEKPKLAGVIFLHEIVGHKRGRLDAFDVPGVKIFVRGQAKKTPIADTDFRVVL